MGSIAAVHIQDIRVQHDRLYQYIAALRNSPSHRKIRSILDDLLSYFLLHASDEEQFMERYRYPFLEEHRTEHEVLLGQLASLREAEPALVAELAKRTGEEMLMHLRTEDRKYVEYFRASGLIAADATLCSFEI